jgi:hypothetical protein
MNMSYGNYKEGAENEYNDPTNALLYDKTLI